MYDDEIKSPKWKKPKVCDGEVETGDQQEDIISDLPDDLLHHILSFLSTESAISTCVLSKRWQDLWMSTTKLELNACHYFKQRNKHKKFTFSYFVDQVLLHHSSNITRFHLFCNIVCNALSVESCISAAVKRQVRELRLVLAARPPLLLPLCLCTSKMLTVLEISSSCKLELPSEIHLSSLKSLCLQNVVFLDRLSFDRLFSGLPILEELEMCVCSLINVKIANITLPTLKRLTFRGSIANQNCFVHVTAENLVNLNYRSQLTLELVLDNKPSLTEANIELGQMARQKRDVGYAINLFRVVCLAKSLKVDEGSLEVLSLEDLNLLPTFLNLTALEVKRMVTNSGNAALMAIFRNAPILESFVTHEVYCGKWIIEMPYPQCIEFCLKNCTLHNFNNRRAELLFVGFVLKAAKMLEILSIHCSVYLSSQPDKVKELMDRVAILPKTATKCVIELILISTPFSSPYSPPV